VLWVWIGIVLGRLVADRGWIGRALGTVGLLLALALNGLAIHAHFFNPHLANHDVRGVAALLRERAAPGDVALVPFKDQSLSYYDTSPASVTMIEFRDLDIAWDALVDATRNAGHIFVMQYEHATRDPLGVTAYALERAGTLEEVIPFWGLDVFVYRLEGPVEPPALEPVDVDLGAAQLVGVRADPAPGDEAMTVALAWQTVEQTGPLKATVQLLDHLGNKIAQDDRQLLDPLRRTSDEWPLGETVVNTYVLPLPKGTPPVTYEVAVGVYPAAETQPGALQPVTEVTVLPPTGRQGDPYEVGDLGLDSTINGELAPGLRLSATNYFPREARPGDSIDVTLRWKASSDLPDLEPALRLTGDDATLLDIPQKPANGQYPTDAWSTGETVLDRRRLHLPSDAPPGTLTLSVVLGDREVELGNLLLVGGSTFLAPQPQYPTDVQFGQVARLVGYDLSGDEISPEEGIQLTLYWQASGPVETDYTVFTHLVDETGELVGQHDFPPVWGMRPTSSWQPGEYLVDVHDVRLLDGVSPSPREAQLMVGLYDPDTLERVLLAGGGDAAQLEAVIELRLDP
jgi:hypothetical protein